MSKIIEIKVPATTSNLGPGFDFLGIALNKYNAFEFELIDSKNNEQIGFDNVGENLVLECFEKIVSKYNRSDIKIRVKLIQNEVPVARGLGSSATAIVAGCVAANYFMNNKLSDEELIKEMVDIEGHPDNILACLYGGAVSSISDDKLYTFKHEINDGLCFNVLIPSYRVKTEDARRVLPKEYSLDKVTYNASRAMLLAKALKDGDIELIKLVTKDVIHEPYRKQFIKEYEKIEELIKDKKAKLNISGSGPTMLLISKDINVLNDIKNSGLDLEIHSLKASANGCQIIEK